MIKFIEQQNSEIDFKPGTILLDRFDTNSGAVLIVNVWDNSVQKGSFAGVYLSNFRYSNDLSKTYKGWVLYRGEISIVACERVV